LYEVVSLPGTDLQVMLAVRLTTVAGYLRIAFLVLWLNPEYGKCKHCGSLVVGCLLRKGGQNDYWFLFPFDEDLSGVFSREF
jgi:hypothetical protein